MDEIVRRLYEGIGAAAEDHFFFTSSGAAAIEEVLMSTYVDFIRETGRTHIVTTPIENRVMRRVFKRLEKLGCSVKTLPLSVQGQLLPDTLEEAIRPRTALLSLAWANPLTGVVHPVFDLARLCKERDVRVHIDATAVLGKLYFRFQDLDADFLTFDGTRAGGLFAKASQKLDLEEVEEIASITAFEASVTEKLARFDHLCTETVRLRDRFEEGVCAALPDARILFQNAERLASTSAIAFPGAESEALAFLLSRRGVVASLGGGRDQTLTEILRAADVDPMLVHSALSFNFSYETKEEEIDRMLSIVVDAAGQLQKASAQLVGGA